MFRQMDAAKRSKPPPSFDGWLAVNNPQLTMLKHKTSHKYQTAGLVTGTPIQAVAVIDPQQLMIGKPLLAGGSSIGAAQRNSTQVVTNGLLGSQQVRPDP